MKQIFLNLKRFDIPPEMGGVNRIAPAAQWGAHIVEHTQEALERWPQARFVMFFPEAHILGAAGAKKQGSPLVVGCQGCWGQDTAIGGNFGAFTTGRTAHSAKAMGCESVLIGHCEERRYLQGILMEAGARDAGAVFRILNRSAACAQAAGLHVLFCIGETETERDNWREVLSAQLDQGVRGLKREGLTIAYEPVWAIGPGKIPPGREAIQETARFIKDITHGLPVVYGGGLKRDNAAMLASIPEIGGGLIALTRFSGEIGFYPEEYLQIVETYLDAADE